jgi:hypothetical protein
MGRCGNERRDKIINVYRLTAGNFNPKAKGIYKKVFNIQNLIFKQTLIEFK